MSNPRHVYWTVSQVTPWGPAGRRTALSCVVADESQVNMSTGSQNVSLLVLLTALIHFYL